MEGFPKHKQVVGPVWGMFLSGSVGGTILEIALFAKIDLGDPSQEEKHRDPESHVNQNQHRVGHES